MAMNVRDLYGHSGNWFKKINKEITHKFNDSDADKSIENNCLSGGC